VLAGRKLALYEASTSFSDAVAGDRQYEP
jgi:hypothetical protein